MLGTRMRQVAGTPVGSSEWWDISGHNCIGAWQGKGAASKAASLVDLSGNDKDLTEIGTVSWDSTNGWTGSRVDGNYFKTGVYVGSNNYSMFVRFTDADTYSYLFGVGANGKRCGIDPYTGSGDSVWFWGTAGWETDSGSGAVSGVAGHAGQDGYINKSNVWSTTSNMGTWAEVYLLGLNFGTPSGSGRVQAFAMYSTLFDSDDVATITDNMNAL